jgi:hypothetical protein
MDIRDELAEIVRDAINEYNNGAYVSKAITNAADAILADFHVAQWRPIEEAPKEGTHILVWCSVERVCTTVWWQGAWYGTDPMHRLNWIQNPTAWQPLPPNPTPRSGDRI